VGPGVQARGCGDECEGQEDEGADFFHGVATILGPTRQTKCQNPRPLSAGLGGRLSPQKDTPCNPGVSAARVGRNHQGVTRRRAFREDPEHGGPGVPVAGHGPGEESDLEGPDALQVR